jgi:hypothetical protein
MANSATTGKGSNVYPDMSNGQVTKLTAAELTTKYSGLTLKTPTANFAFPYRGIIMDCRSGQPIMCDAALLAAFTAASAPVA